MAKRAFHATIRRLARFVPPGMLFWLLLPYSAMRGLPMALQPADVPVRHLPPLATDRAPEFMARWLFQTSIRHRALIWIWWTEWQGPRWRKRVRAIGTQTTLPRDRAVVIVTLHTHGIDMLNLWLMTQGMSVGGIARPEIWELYGSLRQSTHPGYPEWQLFPTGDARSMIRFLAPGRCLVLAADHPLGRTAVGSWDGGQLRLAVGAFRLARQTGASVVPVLVTNAGRWQFDVHVGEAVPQHLIDDGNYEAAVGQIARELMPIAAARPAEAYPTLVKAVSGPG